MGFAVFDGFAEEDEVEVDLNEGGSSRCCELGVSVGFEGGVAFTGADSGFCACEIV